MAEAFRTDRVASLTDAMVGRALAIRRASMPPDVVTLARQCILDCLGVAIAGARDPVVALLVEDAEDHGGHAAASLLGRRERVARTQAARINGVAAHVLDYDDVNLNINGHPSAVLLPALLALGEGLDRRGGDLLAAFVAGYETSCRIGRTIDPGHYELGFHATATIGTFGAAIACAHLLGLSTRETASALGLAGMQASGLKALFGTPGKPLQVGLAAENGVRSALLARRGVTTRTDILEAKQGFAVTHAPTFEPGRATEKPDHYYIREGLFKYHAACFNTHSAIEAIRNLRETHGFGPERVRAILVRVAKAADSICNIAEPRTGMEAKFSLRFCSALAMTGSDTSHPAAFSDAATREPALVALRDKVRVELMDDWPHMQAEVVIELNDGDRLAARLNAGQPSHSLEYQETRLTQKFRLLATSVLGEKGSSALLTALERLDDLAIREIVALCRLR